MDPVGPWSAYASYNRLAAGVQAATSSSNELHHHPHHLPTTSGVTSTTTAQLLPGGFLSPTPVPYETVFSPLFHHAASAKPTAAHYVTQHRAQALVQAQAAAAAAKQSSDGGDYHQSQTTFFEQNSGGAAAVAAAAAWQQNSPFGILPHESVVGAAAAAAASTTTPTTTTKTTAYENFNAHFAAAQSLNHLNSQLEAVKNAANRAQSPQVSSAATSKSSTQTNSNTFFQGSASFSNSDNNNSTTNKSFTSNSSNIQQSCIVSTPSNTPSSKDYRIPQAPTRGFLASPNNAQRTMEKNYQTKQTAPTQIQTKAQTKIYPELTNQTERQRNNEETQSQSSPISFSIMDAPGRLNYSGSNSSGKRPPQFQHANYRHFTQQNSQSEQDFQRPKSGSDYNTSNGPDCSVVIPRRPSPLQAHSQASPLGHAPSPAYPMYNSPMNSISSPQQSSSNQVTPPSPLDVTVPRPNSQSNNVAYPSVITRALNSDKSFSERYERSQQQNNQNCWDDRQNAANRKYQNQTNQSTYNSANSIEITRNEQGQQRASGLTITERQQAYFDTNSNHQVALQDLSSCRGDPMSIVKNLQQQSCQVPQVDVKQEVKVPAKRRKSTEKVPVQVNDVQGRIPPPAHTSGSNQQQNGAYFDFDRWNLPPPSSKIFSTQTIHQQHQSLMVPHPHGHHPPPPLPYFAPFHLPPHPAEFPSSVDLPSISSYADQNTQNQYHHHHHHQQQQQQQQHQQQQQQQQPQHQQQQQENQPKVVVPNIEEELNFLAQTTPTTTISRPGTNNVNKPSTSSKPNDKQAGGGAGFMSSYLKFLQGERDNSPPPGTRTSRKQTTWGKTKQTDEKISETNGMILQPQQQQPPQQQQLTAAPPLPPPPIPPVITRLSSQGDPQDDPRYFPLPKERKRNSFDDSDDGISSDDDFFNNTKLPFQSKINQNKEKTNRRRKTNSTDRTIKRTKRSKPDRYTDGKDDNSIENIPRRELSKRAAKEKTNLQNLVKNDDDIEEPVEYQDSDSDPAWTPQAKEDDDDSLGKKSKKNSSKKKRNLITAAAQGAGIQEIDGYISDQSIKKANKNKQNSPPTLEDNIAASIPNNTTLTATDDGPFKPGEFLVIKSQVHVEWPVLWRVDGRMLLQKFEPFEQNGVTLYKNISMYTSWTPENKDQYMSVPVRLKSHNQSEIIVEFLRNEIVIIDNEYKEKCMKENEIYQDNFEVYIQTLISQALDSNFLTEIFQEKDEYFLSNVKTIDDITENKKRKLMSLLRWPPSVQAAVCTWPCFNVIREVNETGMQMKNCTACGQHEISVRVLMYGQPYNSTTLEGCQPDPKAMNEKNFLMCRTCANRVELSNRVTHQKYLMYIECAKRVSEKRSTDPSKDTTCILNELLADENWLNQLFYEVRTHWAEIDCIEYSLRLKNNSVFMPH